MASELKQILRDGNQRLILRQSWRGQWDAVRGLILFGWQLLTEGIPKPLGADSQLLHLTLKNDPVRGQRYYLEAQFVTREWRNRKRVEAGRSTPQGGDL